MNHLTIKQKLAFGIGLPTTIMVLVGMIIFLNLKSIQTTNQWVTHTHKVLGEANGIVASAVDMETGMRGYLLAGKEKFLEPYNRGRSLFEQQVESLKKPSAITHHKCNFSRRLDKPSLNGKQK